MAVRGALVDVFPPAAPEPLRLELDGSAPTDNPFYDGAPITAFESDKVRALLAYLAVESGRPQRREMLAGLLWPERPDAPQAYLDLGMLAIEQGSYGEAVSLPTRGDRGFELSPEQVAGAWTEGTRALMLASPANPTGQCLTAEQLGAHYAGIRHLGGALIVDEIYQGLSYEVEPITALSLDTDYLFVVNSFSKYFGMTGWRIGYAAGPAAVINAMATIQSHVEETNRSVAEDEMLSGCQVHRFVVLHKELDADDGEMTRTRKVRRRIVEEKFKDLIDALYDGSSEIYTETEVTYEDGRKGSISATLTIRDAAVVDVPDVKVAAE